MYFTQLSSREAEGDRHGFSIAAIGNQTFIYGACASCVLRQKEIRKQRKPAKARKTKKRSETAHSPETNRAEQRKHKLVVDRKTLD